MYRGTLISFPCFMFLQELTDYEDNLDLELSEEQQSSEPGSLQTDQANTEIVEEVKLSTHAFSHNKN